MNMIHLVYTYVHGGYKIGFVRKQIVRLVKDVHTHLPCTLFGRVTRAQAPIFR